MPANPSAQMTIETADGSKTLYSGQFGEHYHSTFGAVNESMHVFIEAGYMAGDVSPVSVLEIGFGTGLNAFLTMTQAEELQRPTYYESVELFPIDTPTALSLSDNPDFMKLHTSAWDQAVHISPCFTLNKRKADLLDVSFTKSFDLVYFDAFSPVVQPEMWQEVIFSKLYDAMNQHAILTTYCAKGEVRRTMQRAGFTMERLPGPKGKREMLSARKER